MFEVRKWSEEMTSGWANIRFLVPLNKNPFLLSRNCFPLYLHNYEDLQLTCIKLSTDRHFCVDLR